MFTEAKMGRTSFPRINKIPGFLGGFPVVVCAAGRNGIVDIRALLLILFTFGSASGLAAQTGETIPYELPEQIVTAIASEETLAPAASRTLITSDDLQAFGATTVTEALAKVPGLSLSPTGAGGAETTLSLRGSTSNQVLVIIDGVRITDPATGRTDFSRLQIPVDDIESMEVIRGALSAQYGADAVGGVVVITTKKGSAQPGFSISFSNKSVLPASTTSGSGAHAVESPANPLSLFDGQSLSFRAGLGSGIGLSFSAEHTSNAFVYYDANYIRRRRENADLTQGKASLSWQGGLGSGKVSTGAEVSARWLGVPGSLDAPTPEARQNDIDANASAEYKTDYFFSDRFAFKAVGYGKFGRISYREDSASGADIHNSTRLGGDAAWSILASNLVMVNTGLSLRYDRLDSTVVVNSEGKAPQRVSLGAFAEPTFRLAGWSLTPSVRWDWTNDFASGISAGMGATKKLSDSLTMSYSLSSAYRAPGFDDLYWPLSGGAEGNPDLKPETAYEGDAGIKWQERNFSLAVSGFARYSHDVILWQENDDGVWRPTNFGDALYPGLELETKAANDPWLFSASYSFLYSYVLSGNLSIADNKRVPYVPIHALTAAVAYNSGPFSASFDISYKGLRYLTTDNKAYLPSAFLANASFRWALNKEFSLKIEGDNLLNERYESVQGYPMPGFSLSTGVTYKPAPGKK